MKKSLKRQAEELAVWIALQKYAGPVPIYSGKRFMADPDGDDLVKPCFVISCESCKANQEMYDPAVGEADISLGLIRDTRADGHDELDQELFKLSQIFMDPEQGSLEMINENFSAPHFSEVQGGHLASIFVHEFALPDENTVTDDEDDQDIFQFSMHLQHISEFYAQVTNPPIVIIGTPVFPVFP